MTYNEETLFLLSELERFGLSREDVEKEMCYSPNYLGQLLSRQSNEKIVKALKMLLRIKVLEMELGHTAQLPKAPSKEDDFKEIVNILKDIHSSLSETKHTEELNQVLLKTNLLQSAKVESLVTNRSYEAIVDDLNKAASKSFEESHLCAKSFHKSRSRSVEA